MTKSILRGLALFTALGAVPIWADWAPIMLINLDINNPGYSFNNFTISINSVLNPGLTFLNVDQNGLHNLGNSTTDIWSVTYNSSTLISATKAVGVSSGETFGIYFALGSQFFTNPVPPSFHYSYLANNNTDFAADGYIGVGKPPITPDIPPGAVPESSSAALTGSWLIGLAFYAYKRKKTGINPLAAA